MSRAAKRIAIAGLALVVLGCSDFGKEPVDEPPMDMDDETPGPKTVQLVASADNTLYEHPSGVLSNGAGQRLFAGVNAGAQLRRALIRFDVRSRVPAGASIDSVALTLYCSKVRDPGARDISIHRVTASWGEAGSVAAAEEGQGNVALAGDATWIHREFDSLDWATPGGDYEGIPSAVTPVGGVGFYTWISPALPDDVRAWANGDLPDHGWIVLGDESAPGMAKRFDSREHEATANRPRLSITFTPGAER